jgi:hypothetical protein
MSDLMLQVVVGQTAVLCCAGIDVCSVSKLAARNVSPFIDGPRAFDVRESLSEVNGSSAKRGPNC